MIERERMYVAIYDWRWFRLRWQLALSKNSMTILNPNEFSLWNSHKPEKILEHFRYRVMARRLRRNGRKNQPWHEILNKNARMSERAFDFKTGFSVGGFEMAETFWFCETAGKFFAFLEFSYRF